MKNSEAHVAELSSQMEKTRAEFDAAKMDLENIAREKEASLKELEARVADVSAELTAAKAEVEALKGDRTADEAVQRVEAEKAELDKKLAEKEKEHEVRVAELVAQQNELMGTKSALDVALKESEARIGELSVEVERQLLWKRKRNWRRR